MRALPLINLLGLLAVLAANAAAVLLPINGYTTGKLSALYPNLFVPAGYAFSIWGLIYLLAVAFVGYGFVSGPGGDHPPGAVSRVGWRFGAACACNVAWIFAWHYRIVWLSVAIMLAYLGALISVHVALRQNRSRPTTTGEGWFVWLPFGVHLGWICVATVANVTAALVSSGFRPEDRVQVYFTLAVIVTVQLLGSWFIRRGNGDVALVSVWALTAIAVKQWGVETPVAILASVGAIMLLFGIVSAFRTQWFSRGLQSS